MKIQYRYQKFPADAAKAVVDVFAGQPYLAPIYMMDRGENPFSTYMEIADRLMVSRRTVSRKIKGLKDKGIISRVGSAKKGHWKRI